MPRIKNWQADGTTTWIHADGSYQIKLDKIGYGNWSTILLRLGRPVEVIVEGKTKTEARSAAAHWMRNHPNPSKASRNGRGSSSESGCSRCDTPVPGNGEMCGSCLDEVRNNT